MMRVPTRVPGLSPAGRAGGALAAAVFLAACPAPDTTAPEPPGGPGEHAVATAHPLATDAAHDILERGGNAFDAAVAATATLGVVEPFGSGIGGGGFWLLHEAASERSIMVDGRETAPGAAHRDLYRDDDGEIMEDASLDGPLAAAIPGTPAALVHLATEYGGLPLSESLQPAIDAAREGFEVGERYRTLMEFRQDVVADSPAAAEVFLDDGDIPAEGHRVVQDDLAETLETLAEDHGESFYRGALARALSRQVRDAGGVWEPEDLADYAVREREPVTFDYRGTTVTAASLPSAGGIGLATMLQMLEDRDLHLQDAASGIHLAVEAMRRAYRDRAEYLGDPDFVDVPVDALTDPDHAQALGASIQPDRATLSDELPEVALDGEGPSTTHFSILDAEGNRVGATLSINYPFGSGFMPEGTGVLLNNEMDDFATAPGEPNAYGLVGGEANRVEAGKRPLSSMTPTFVEDDGRVGILGTPGGSRIITQVLIGVLLFDDGAHPQEWVSRPRFHHQYLPDRIEHEPDALPEAVRETLTEKGHELYDVGREYGDMHAVLWDRAAGTLETGTDPRGDGAARIRD